MNPAKAPARVGVMIPTYRRPDLARACVLQWLVQSLPPACVCVHQNGSEHSYAWCVDDLQGLGHVAWLHTPEKLPQQRDWYLRPLRFLLDQGCSHFFWADHDDLYLRDHAAQCVAELESADFSVASHCGVLYLRHDDYRWVPGSEFNVHAGGGMSSSIAFTRAFAEQLAADLEQDRVTHYADNVLALTTLPKFERTVLSPRQSTVYVAHKGSLTSAGWLDDVFGSERVATGETVRAAQGLGPVLYGTLAAGYQDVTQQVIAQCSREGANGCWAVPEADWQRGAILGDPVPNQLKHLVLRSLPDEQGRLTDRVLRDGDRCLFRYARGVLSAEVPGPAGPAFQGDPAGSA